MSHFSTIKTKMVVPEFLLKALDDLGYRWERGNVRVRGYAGNRTPVEIRIPNVEDGYDIGFLQVGDSYQAVADWNEMRRTKQSEFLNPIQQRYAYHATVAKLKDQGFQIANEETAKDGQIRLTLRRMA